MDYCKQGLENLCDNAAFTGYHKHGGYAEYTVAPADYVYSIPDTISSDTSIAPLLCAGVIGYRSLRLSDIKPEQNLGLYGFGASAHICIQMARRLKCNVYVFTRSKEHQRHAIELGAVWAGHSNDTPSEKMHSSIIFAPSGDLVPIALTGLNKGGTLAINAIHMSPIPEMAYRLIYSERTLRSIANCTRRDVEEFLKLASEIPVHVATEIFPLKQANHVLQRLKCSKIRGAAVLEI